MSKESGKTGSRQWESLTSCFSPAPAPGKVGGTLWTRTCLPVAPSLAKTWEGVQCLSYALQSYLNAPKVKTNEASWGSQPTVPKLSTGLMIWLVDRMPKMPEVLSPFPRAA